MGLHLNFTYLFFWLAYPAPEKGIFARVGAWSKAVEAGDRRRKGGSGLGLWEFNRGSRRLPKAAMSSSLPVLFAGMACTRARGILKVSIFNKTNKQKANE